MKVSFLVTNGGPHPPDKWADQTAERICDLVEIDPQADSPELVQARRALARLQLDLADALVEPHRINMAHERKQLGKLGDARLGHGYDPTEHKGIDAAMTAVVALTDKLPEPIKSHFEKPDVLTVVRRIIGDHFASAMHIERSYHADKHPDSKHAKAFRARQLDGNQ